MKCRPAAWHTIRKIRKWSDLTRKAEKIAGRMQPKIMQRLASADSVSS
jgi:hypothetical protein